MLLMKNAFSFSKLFFHIKVVATVLSVSYERINRPLKQLVLNKIINYINILLKGKNILLKTDSNILHSSFESVTKTDGQAYFRLSEHTYTQVCGRAIL